MPDDCGALEDSKLCPNATGSSEPNVESVGALALDLDPRLPGM